jgi:phage gpG-like protein
VSSLAFSVDDVEVQRQLAGLRAALGSLAKPLDAIGFAVTQRMLGTFRDQEDPWGARWSPLSAVTIAFRRKGRGPGADQILRDTGALMNSITHRVIGNAVEIGPGPSTKDYAPTHQFGRPSNRMFGKAPAPIPARPFAPIQLGGYVDLPEDWSDEILDVVSVYLEDAAGTLQ